MTQIALHSAPIAPARPSRRLAAPLYARVMPDSLPGLNSADKLQPKKFRRPE